VASGKSIDDRRTDDNEVRVHCVVLIQGLMLQMYKLNFRGFHGTFYSANLMSSKQPILVFCFQRF
jgi:hypothetical protein